MASRQYRLGLISLASLLLAAGCAKFPVFPRPAPGPAVVPAAQVPQTTVARQSSTTFTRFPDMPIPAGGSFDMERTLLFGTSDSWFGRMVIDTKHDSEDMFSFYQTQLPAFGWQELTAVRAAVAAMTHVRGDRVATIQIEARTLRGSEITVIVSPRGIPASRPGSSVTKFFGGLT